MIDKKAEILRCGRALYSSQGFKSTNVADITKMAGIGTGTFYNYYLSKDELFMEIFLEENVKLKKQIMETINLDGDPMNVMKELMVLNINGMNSNPILKQWYDRDVFSKIERNFIQAKGIEQIDFMYHSFKEIVEKWVAEGKMRNDIKVEMIMAIFTAIIHIDIHKEEVGLAYFPEVIEYLTEFTMKGLTDCSKV